MESRTRNIVVGSLLGDGWMVPILPSGKSSYHVKYSNKAKGYLEWLRDQISELNPAELKPKEKYSQHYFYTRYSKELGELRKIFYPNGGKKRVPKNISKLLDDPIGLAVWYQDDGTLDCRSKYHWNVRIATYCFPYEDCVILAKAVKKNFNIEMSVCRCTMRGKVYYQLYVLSKSMSRFIETVRPYIHSDYAYKINSLNKPKNAGQQQR